ncbi:uncharacterized protein EV154DRAFT_576964 [Mucor mucedo]|uniref:uncharacterized protein n=1 Tax=Mucor mucedo TaxID=29922 RepID=UPI00221F7014|nr:uncharacterized protein EV154DRAFT_576964 [Mucor mucedo]KAI7877084.1 hypothetical protein EV154DRAFT_576964 [Mucor mucedo]
MRFFLIITTALAFSFSANAKHHIKRASKVQSCTAGLKDANEQFLILKTIARNQHVSFQAYHFSEPLLESYVQSAISNCCASLALPDEEVDSVVSTFGITTTKIVDLYDVFISKESPSFSAASAATTLKDTIRSLSGVIKNLDECLLSVTPSSRQPEIQTYIDTIKNKIDTTFTTYGMTA